MVNSDSPTRPRAVQLVSQALLGLSLIAVGIVLIDYAMDSMSIGRPIARAWIIALAGLMLLIPGVVTVLLATSGTFARDKRNGRRARGPKPWRFC